MIYFFRIVGWCLWVLMFPARLLFWLMCRLQAEQCPQCGSQWRTELFDEWDGELWACNACGRYWEVKGHWWEIKT